MPITPSPLRSEPPAICEVLPSAAALVGVPGTDDTLGLRDRVGDVARVVVVLIDGMGYHLLERMAPHAPFLAAVLADRTGGDGLARLDELTCTFPSTTPTSLVSLATGVAPGEHGVLGFTVNVPGTDRVLTHIFWRDDPRPEDWQPVPTVYERAAAAGVAASVVLPAAFAGSGLTRAAYRGARYCALGEGEDNADRLLAEVRAGPGLVFGYDAALDTAAHAHGIASAQWAVAAAHCDTLLRRLAEGLPADTALLVTADHGGLDIPTDGRLDVDTDPRLAAGLRVVAGEPRVRYLHTVDGATDDVLAAWSAVLGDRAEVLARNEAIAGGLFGPVRDAHRARIGDVVVICHGDAVVLATDREPDAMAKLVGFHGGTSPAETAIPLLTLRR